ncbi:MAG: RraA family protein [Armatimonadota bacterium]|nr:RraA family protein [Armatimonadota bacterium]MDR7428310.1 RraA family protein [Armatimonadota bacterium]MDR7463421.1 RraA family protein [Armatimonadota bacterium]MDR7470208.1 RraA family protein [Armatimonadota bacterium]MDR7475560.1 RraA family protein [Armatimonadota bacterium]
MAEGAELYTLLEGFRATSTASVADAVDRVVRRPGFMSHEIKPILPGRIAGPAVTVLERTALEAQPPRHALTAIDEAPAGSIIVIGLEDAGGAPEVALWGGLMASAAATRGLGGAVLDGGVRDVEEIRQLGFPVFSRTIVPSTSVGRLVTVAREVPVPCGGVLVNPGDIIVGDSDGVVVVPRAAAAEVLAAATQIEETERRMTARIRASGSILQALQEFGRI